jgi:class 3 adenylate cyclase
VISLVQRLIKVCEAAPVLGRPRYLARFVEQGLCRLRWVAAAVIPLWAVTLALHLRFVRAQIGSSLTPGPALVTLSPTTTVVLPIAIAVLGAIGVLVFPRAATGIGRARTAVALFASAALAGEGLQLGLSGGESFHMPSLTLASLLFLTLAPLSPRGLGALAVFALAVPAASALAVGTAGAELPTFLASLSLPAAASVLGAVLNLWTFRSFRQRSLAELRLRRRTAEIERQRRIAESERERAMQLLASALTAPVAERYARQGFVEPSTRHVVLIFCDAVGFSQACEKMLPERIVAAMREFWLRFDDACQSVGVEPLRAEGDARIAIAGLGMDGGPVFMHRAAIGAILAMIRFRRFLPPLVEADETLPSARDNGCVMWPARIGISIGAVAAGVIDTSHAPSFGDAGPERTRGGRLWFDVWGDTLNVAARLAQTAHPNQILTRERVLWEAGGLFVHGPVHSRRIKKGVLPDCAEIVHIHPEYRNADGEPNEAFWAVYNRESYRPVRPDPQGTLAPYP